MHVSPEFVLELMEFRTHPLPHCLPQHDELPVPRLITAMRESKEVEGFGLPRASSLAVPGRIAAKLDQASFLGVQFKVKLVESLPQVLQESLGILTVLESCCDVVSKSHDDHLAVCMLLPPLLDPEVKHVVEIYVRQ